MFCTKCGNHVENGTKYCNKCGTFLGAPINSIAMRPPLEQGNEIINSNHYSPDINPNVNQDCSTVDKRNKKQMVFIGTVSGVVLLVVIG